MKGNRPKRQRKQHKREQQWQDDHPTDDQQQFDEHDESKLTSKERLNRMSCEQQIQLVKDISERIVFEPEKNIRHVSTMLTLMRSDNIATVTAAIDGLANVFTSIGPVETGIEQHHDQKNKHRLKKVEYELRTFEKSVIEGYQRYIDLLKQLSKSLKKEQFSNNQNLFMEFRKCVIRSTAKCLQGLWSAEESKQLVPVLCKYVKDRTVQGVIGQFLSDHNPEVLSIKLCIVKAVSLKIMKKAEKDLPENLVAILNTLHIDSSHLDKDEDGQKYKKKREKRKEYKDKEDQKKKDREKDPLELKRERKRNRKLQKELVKQEVNRDFAEGQVRIDHKKITRINSELLQEMFYIYFKILLKRSYSQFLKDCLDGMLKFGHLINTVLIKSLIENLSYSADTFRKLFKQTNDKQYIEAGLYVVFTAESIINGPAQVFSMADHREAVNFYRLLKDINKADPKKVTLDKDIYRMVLKIIDEMMFKKRQLSIEVVGSVAREIALAAKRKQAPRVALLEVLRMLSNVRNSISQKYNKILRMFEEDNEGYGLNSFNPAVEDPQASNSLNTSLVEVLQEIRKLSKAKDELAVVDRLLNRQFQADRVYTIDSLIQSVSSK